MSNDWRDELQDLTHEDMIKVVRHAIFVIMTTGQEYRIGTRSVKRADLNALRQFLHDLEGQTDTPYGLFGGVSVSVHDRR